MLNKYDDKIARLRLMDDKFMKVCFKDHPEVVEKVLQIILGTKDIKISDTFMQDYIANLNGKSVILDIVAEDINDKIYDLEVQREKEKAGIKRLRYISAMLDYRSLKEGKEYVDLSETYIIFITENDYFGKGLQQYHIKKIISETNDIVDDGLHLIYVNASYKSENELGNLCHDFLCSDPEKMKIPELKKISKFYKSEGGREYMSGVFEEVKEEERVNVLDIIDKYQSNEITAEDAANNLGLTIDEVIRRFKKN